MLTLVNSVDRMNFHTAALRLLFPSKYGELLSFGATARVSHTILADLRVFIILFIISSIRQLNITGMIGAAIELMTLESLIAFFAVELL